MSFDTIEALQITNPLPVANFGSVFWSQSYTSAKRPIDGFPDFQAFLNQPWTVHYAIPSYGGFKLDLKLTSPLRTDNGFENVDIFVDPLMGTIERSYTRDWERKPKVSDLSVPEALVQRLEKMLLKWHGERLMVHYCLFPGEGDPLSILVEFSRCERLRLGSPDETLAYITQELTEALAS
ncbi:MAG: hypothetical protein WC794_03950 [Candidatus Doudnabacteria bacterium]|jgi:hypothetical protein